MSLLATFAIAASLGAMPPQEADLGQEPTRVEDVEVTAQMRSELVRQQVESFIEHNIEPPKGRPLARWNKPVCIATAYLNQQYAQAVIDSIAARIIEFGGDVDGPGCKANLMVVGTTNGSATAKDLVRNDRDGFTPAMNSTNLSTRQLRKFENGDEAVRWWHVSMPIMIEGGEIAVRLKGDDFHTVNVTDGSRLRTNTRDDLMRVVIVVDFSKTSHIPVTSLIDYISFVGMTQVAPGYEATSFDSILNLFNDPQNVTGLTQWDRDYLSALYIAPPNRPSIDAQVRDITTQVLMEREGR